MNFSTKFFSKKIFLTYNYFFLFVLYNVSIYKLIVINNEKTSFFILGLFILEVIVFTEYQKTISKLENVDDILLVSEDQLERLHEYQNEIVVLKSLLESKRVWIRKLDFECSKINNNSIKNIFIQKINQTKFLRINYDIKVTSYYNNEFALTTEKSVCKLLNVFIDNAIESCQNSNKKLIAIEILESSKKIEIVIANYINESINLDLISEKGFSTKGFKRGFGLSEAIKIVDKNKEITNQTEIIGNVFLQRIVIEI